MRVASPRLLGSPRESSNKTFPDLLQLPEETVDLLSSHVLPAEVLCEQRAVLGNTAAGPKEWDSCPTGHRSQSEPDDELTA